jgi:hypothetical protein
VVEFHDGGCLWGDGGGELVQLLVKSAGLEFNEREMFSSQRASE